MGVGVCGVCVGVCLGGVGIKHPPAGQPSKRTALSPDRPSFAGMKENCGGRGKKREILGPPPFAAATFGTHHSKPQPSVCVLVFVRVCWCVCCVCVGVLCVVCLCLCVIELGLSRHFKTGPT